MSDHRTDTIRALNDAARQTFTGCVLIVTPAFEKHPLTTKAHVLKSVREFQDFDEVRDTEHRYGVINYQGTEFFFHMAYYDLSLQVHSPDPANPRVTRRVLTVGLASEDL
jgi:Protein of unknown function (DUF3768)